MIKIFMAYFRCYTCHALSQGTIKGKCEHCGNYQPTPKKKR